MLLSVSVILVLASAVSARHVVPESNIPYGHIRNIAIPKAEELRKEEERNAESGKIINGGQARLGEFPWQAGMIATIGANQAVCGGSLVSSNRIVTAAHNIRSGSTVVSGFTIVLGSINIFSGGTRLVSGNLVLHPQYVPTITYMNDIAMIYLQSSVGFSANIAPVSLPSGGEASQDFAGFPAVASGFGLTEAGVPSSTLRRLDFNILTHNQCVLSSGSFFQPTHLCATSAPGTGVCVGDSGGPLVVQNNNRPVLVGIVSFTLGACGEFFPDGFTRVTSFLNFINQHM